MLTRTPAATRACPQDVYCPSTGSPGNPQDPTAGCSRFHLLPCRNRLGKPPHHPAPVPLPGPWGVLGEGPQDLPSLLKALTAAVVTFPDSPEKEEKVALLVLAGARTFEARGAEQHDNSEPCVVLTSFPSLTATCWTAGSQRACCPSNPHHPAWQRPGSTTEGTSLCVASRLAGLQ